MNPARNPYSPGAGLRPRELAGRESEIEKFGFLTERAMAGLVSKSLVMTGLRGWVRPCFSTSWPPPHGGPTGL